MVSRPDGDQFHFDPATYLDMVLAEVPAYVELQDATAVGDDRGAGRTGAGARRRHGRDVGAGAAGPPRGGAGRHRRERPDARCRPRPRGLPKPIFE